MPASACAAATSASVVSMRIRGPSRSSSPGIQPSEWTSSQLGIRCPGMSAVCASTRRRCSCSFGRRVSITKSRASARAAVAAPPHSADARRRPARRGVALRSLQRRSRSCSRSDAVPQRGGMRAPLRRPMHAHRAHDQKHGSRDQVLPPRGRRGAQCRRGRTHRHLADLRVRRRRAHAGVLRGPAAADRWRPAQASLRDLAGRPLLRLHRLRPGGDRRPRPGRREPLVLRASVGANPQRAS